jgi:hypothetical protein
MLVLHELVRKRSSFRSLSSRQQPIQIFFALWRAWQGILQWLWNTMSAFDRQPRPPWPINICTSPSSPERAYFFIKATPRRPSQTILPQQQQQPPDAKSAASRRNIGSSSI